MNEHKNLLMFFGGMEQGLCFPSLVKKILIIINVQKL